MASKPKRPRCTFCGKAVFATQEDAIGVAWDQVARRDLPLQRIYACGDGWHLTRKPWRPGKS